MLSTILWLLVTSLGLIVTLTGVLGVLGSRLPRTHTASVRITLPASAEVVFGLLERVEDMPTWVPDITRVTRLPDQNGLPVHRQEIGRNAFTTVTTAHEPPRRITRTITDSHAPFTGSWDHLIEPQGDAACVLTLTETGAVSSAVPRAIMHYVFGEDMYLKRFAGHLTRKVGG